MNVGETVYISGYKYEVDGYGEENGRMCLQSVGHGHPSNATRIFCDRYGLERLQQPKTVTLPYPVYRAFQEHVGVDALSSHDYLMHHGLTFVQEDAVAEYDAPCDWRVYNSNGGFTTLPAGKYKIERVG